MAGGKGFYSTTRAASLDELCSQATLCVCSESVCALDGCYSRELHSIPDSLWRCYILCMSLFDLLFRYRVSLRVWLHVAAFTEFLTFIVEPWY